MKLSRRDVRSKSHGIPQLRFENATLTSFAGLVLFQQFFWRIELKSRVRCSFRHLRSGKVFDRATIFIQLILHLLLGYRQLRECQHYRDDPLVKRLLGMKRLPDVGTLSRMLKEADEKSVHRLRRLLREMIIERLKEMHVTRLTLDFDGSVQSTGRRAEGTAVGFNRKKKGARSYYPLFCTLAQTGQVLDFLHRAGNVHDSQGAQRFILACIAEIRAGIPWGVHIEVRMDSAFFSDEIVQALQRAGVEFTISVPFERFAQLKQMIEDRRRWHRLRSGVHYFESAWKPQSWSNRFRFLFIRTRNKKQQKGPVQLDLFVPYEYGYDFKVIVTNKDVQARTVVAFHEGRGAQEGIFAELKTNCHADYIPVRRRCGNQMYLLAGLFAHNLVRELQMATSSPCRTITAKRPALWAFETLHTLRLTLIQRAGRLTKPSGSLTLTISANNSLKRRLLKMCDALQLSP